MERLLSNVSVTLDYHPLYQARLEKGRENIRITARTSETVWNALAAIPQSRIVSLSLVGGNPGTEHLPVLVESIKVLGPALNDDEHNCLPVQVNLTALLNEDMRRAHMTKNALIGVIGPIVF